MSIDIFYGSTDYVTSLLGNQLWFSQAQQDQAVMRLLKYPRNGFFIDLASNNATALSNTYAMDRYYGWTGLCIESHYRPNCQIVAAVVGGSRMEQIKFRYNYNEGGGIVGEQFDNLDTYGVETTKEYTVTLFGNIRVIQCRGLHHGEFSF